MKTTTINLSELDDYFKIVESNRDLAVRLHLFKEVQKEQLRRLEEIKGISATLAIRVQSSKQKKSFIDLSEEDKKFINKLLVDRHIKI